MLISLIHSSQLFEYAGYATGSCLKPGVFFVSYFDWLNSNHLFYSPVNLNSVSIWAELFKS